MKPMEALKMLDSIRRNVERRLEKLPPDSTNFHWAQSEIAALTHAARLIAFEVQYVNQLKEAGEYRNNRKSAEFLQEVVAAAPKDV